MTVYTAGVGDATAWCAQYGAIQSVEEMPGGASLRRFFRVEFVDGTRGIAMFFPDAQTTGASRLPEAPTRWPFLEIQETLAQHGIPVPAILATDCDAGWLLVEDLGRECLADYLQREPGARDRAYTQAVRDIASAQAALSVLPAESVIRKRRFDFDFLRGELEHFREYGLEARGIWMNETQCRKWERFTSGLCQRITELPYGFSHRDYQSRNLMVSEPLRLTWLDFQDAALGPRVYDLVALLRDSYQSLDESFVDARLADYASAGALPQKERIQVRREFDLVTVQRKLKDAGRFVFINKQKGDSTYLPYVEPTIALVMNTLRSGRSDDCFAGLHALLSELGLSA